MSALLSTKPFFNLLFNNNNISLRPIRKPLPSLLVSSSNPLSTTLRYSSSSLLSVAPVEAVLFDIDGTLCDSDPLHYYAFRDMLQEVGFNGGESITEEFFIQNISGKHNSELSRLLLPEWEFETAMKFMEDKEAYFRRLASKQLEPVDGLHKMLKWVDDLGLKRAAVTNAPKENAELLLSMLGLTDFFSMVVLGNDCDRAKPFPDPYLKALEGLQASPSHTFVFEDSVSGIKAGVAAGMPVVGIASRNPANLLLEAGAVFVIKDFNDPILWTALEETAKLT
ncbi:haloacid dehalogenase-like hydrolase domain-containing protein Sgpp isoform X1 [Impatiens glandulifera]|uniref:haloacid dehalogenase-like hydrolase domain-containing protein Sgpp isoform X1 n=1 Tax=Impatiens glandulifera TaxID=253017 RepID=UPI001FB1619D|nr:haloacid dehalogenase-like hydrolase domain-containing protein Sgpp isoform X1 [Impatiens glandulifera]